MLWMMIDMTHRHGHEPCCSPQFPGASLFCGNRGPFGTINPVSKLLKL